MNTCIICYGQNGISRCKDFANCRCEENKFCNDCYDRFHSSSDVIRCPICYGAVLHRRIAINASEVQKTLLIYFVFAFLESILILLSPFENSYSIYSLASAACSAVFLTTVNAIFCLYKPNKIIYVVLSIINLAVFINYIVMLFALENLSVLIVSAILTKIARYFYIKWHRLFIVLS